MEKEIINALLQRGMTIEQIKKYITEIMCKRDETKIPKENKLLFDAYNKSGKRTLYITTKR